MPLPIGALAPDFTLRDQNNQKVSLSAYRGARNVLLVFFPLAFTGTCTGELSYIRDHLPDFQNDGAEVIGISVSPSPSHKIWSSEQGYLFPILADFWPHGDVSQAYEVFNDAHGYPNRGTFVIDRDGRVAFSEMLGPGEMRDPAHWERVGRALSK